MKKLTPAASAVWKHLHATGSITHVEAQTVHRVFDLAGRVMEIRKALKEGPTTPYEVRSVFKRDLNGARYVKYTLFVRKDDGSVVSIAEVNHAAA